MVGKAPSPLYSKLSVRATILLSVVIVGAAASMMLLMGRTPICTCGTVKIWHGIVTSSENSQHLSDWYTFSHIIHGFIFFGLAHLAGRAAGRPIPVRAAFVAALVAEAGWEVFENTDFIINRYREATIALDYYGDSVVNSMADIGAMVFGFFLGFRLPVWLTILTGVAMELFTLVMIGDNLTLNVLMLLWPLESVKEWQSGF